MNQIPENTRLNYMIEGAKRSRYNSAQWFRYLRKVVDGNRTLLTSEEIEVLINSGMLTMFQKITLKRAMQPGTLTNSRVVRLNQRTNTPMVNEVLRRHGHV